MINKHGTMGNEFNFYSNLGPKLNTVIDVGARDSFFTDLECEVHYFEPDSKAFTDLGKKITKNNHYINKLGLGMDANNKKLYNESGSTNIRPSAFVNYGINEDIKIIRLDSYVLEKNIKQISLLKIDTEGMEYEVLKGLGDYLKICEYIIFEYAWDTAEAAGVDFYDIKNLLTDFDLFEMGIDGELITLDEQKITAKVRPNTNNIVAKYRNG